jgi:adenylate kinase
MIILLTGTPGTGKTTISPLLAEKLGCQVVDINHLVEEKQLYTGLDPEKGYKVVDLDALEEELHKILNFQENSKHPKNNSCKIIEGHLSHYFPNADLVVVFRTEPLILEDRLKKRDWQEVKIRENLEAEALDICTWESYQIHGKNVHEIDTSNITPENAVDIILEIISGKKSFPPGSIDFSAYLG